MEDDDVSRLIDFNQEPDNDTGFNFQSRFIKNVEEFFEGVSQSEAEIFPAKNVDMIVVNLASISMRLEITQQKIKITFSLSLEESYSSSKNDFLILMDLLPQKFERMRKLIAMGYFPSRKATIELVTDDNYKHSMEKNLVAETDFIHELEYLMHQLGFKMVNTGN